VKCHYPAGLHRYPFRRTAAASASRRGMREISIVEELAGGTPARREPVAGKWRVYACVMRLVSLLPSATEIVYALGLGGQLVGVTFECDEPPSARADKTVVVGGLDTRGVTPREIAGYVHGRPAARSR